MLTFGWNCHRSGEDERLTKWPPVDGDMRLNTLSTFHNRIKHFKFGVLLENKSYYITSVFKIHLLGTLLLQSCGMINFSLRLRVENAAFHIHFQRDPLRAVQLRRSSPSLQTFPAPEMEPSSTFWWQLCLCETTLAAQSPHSRLSM